MCLSNEKNTFVDNSRVEPTIVLIEKLSFSLKLFSGHFYGQFFIKTFRGPFVQKHLATTLSYQVVLFKPLPLGKILPQEELDPTTLTNESVP